MTSSALIRASASLLLCVILTPWNASAQGASGRKEARAVAPSVNDCPLALSLPSGWARAVLPSSRVNPARNMRFTYGAGPDNVVALSVSVRETADVQREAASIVANGLMVAEPPLSVAGRSTPVWHSRPGDAQAGRGGSDAWLLALPLDDEDSAQIRVTVIAGRGVMPPGTAVVRGVLESIRPGACLSEEPDPM